MITNDTVPVRLLRLDGAHFDEVDVWLSPEDRRKLSFGLCRDWRAVITDQATDHIYIAQGVRCDGLDCRCQGVITGRGSRACQAMMAEFAEAGA